MSCEKYQSMLTDAALGAETSPELSAHLSGCAECSRTLAEMQKTLALLDEWQAPEPSSFFDTRMQALLREERQNGDSRQHRVLGWLRALRRPIVGYTSAAILATGMGVFALLPQIRHDAKAPTVEVIGAKGTAVGDLQMLDKSADLAADYDAVNDDGSTDNN